MDQSIPASQSLDNFYLDSIRGRVSAEVFYAIVCIAANLENRSAEYLRPFGLTLVKFNALVLIKHKGQDEGLSQNELSHHMIVSPSNITRLIDRLIGDGLVMRSDLKHDRRFNLIKVTKKGSDLLDKVWHGYGELIQKSVYLLSRPEAEQLSELLLKWFSKINTDNKKESK